MKLCIDCKYYKHETGMPLSYHRNAYLCSAMAQEHIDLVTGQKYIASMMYCYNLRESEYCGTEGKLFQPK